MPNQYGHLLQQLRDVGATPIAQHHVTTGMGGSQDGKSVPEVVANYVGGREGRFSAFILTGDGLLVMVDAEGDNARKKALPITGLRQITEELIDRNLTVFLEVDAGPAIVEQFRAAEDDVPELDTAGTFKPHVWVIRVPAEGDTSDRDRLYTFVTDLRAAFAAACRH